MSSFVAPRKSLGQNFLQDQNVISKIVASLNSQADDVVVEIGPGRGALTELLLRQSKQLHLIEFDRDLVDYWRRRPETVLSQNNNPISTQAKYPRLIVHGADVLKFDFAQIINEQTQSLKVIGNLPYNISSPVLFHLMRHAEQIATQVLMLQKEVVERMVARPGNKQYGRLSVMLQQRYSIEHLFNVAPGAFYPPPKVDSAVARLMPLIDSPYQIQDHSDFAMVVKQAFSQRRKTLRNTLKDLLSVEQIQHQDIDPSARAETLAVHDFCRLANIYTTVK